MFFTNKKIKYYIFPHTFQRCNHLHPTLLSSSHNMAEIFPCVVVAYEDDSLQMSENNFCNRRNSCNKGWRPQGQYKPPPQSSLYILPWLKDVFPCLLSFLWKSGVLFRMS